MPKRFPKTIRSEWKWQNPYRFASSPKWQTDWCTFVILTSPFSLRLHHGQLLFDSNNESLEDWCFGEWVDFSRNQDIGFWVVHECIPGANVIKSSSQYIGHPTDLVPNRDLFIFFQSKSSHVLRMQQDDVSSILTTIVVFVFVDDRIELAFASNGHQAEFVLILSV